MSLSIAIYRIDTRRKGKDLLILNIVTVKKTYNYRRNLSIHKKSVLDTPFLTVQKFRSNYEQESH